MWEIKNRARADWAIRDSILDTKERRKEVRREGESKEGRKGKKRENQEKLIFDLIISILYYREYTPFSFIKYFPTILTEQLCTDFFLKCLQEILKCISRHLEVQKGEMIKKTTNGTKQAWDGHPRPTSKRVVVSSAQPWDKGLVRISHKRDHPGWHVHSCKMQWKLRLISQESMSSFVLREQTVG